MSRPDPIEQAMLDAANCVLSRRSTALRAKAANMTSVVENDGKTATVLDPGARVALGTADLFDAIVASLVAGGVLHGR